MSTSGNILSIGLGDLVSARNAALRTAGFDVTSAICLEDVFRLCGNQRFDVAIVGHAFTLIERAEFVRCIKGDFLLPVILIEDGQVMASLHPDSHIHVNDSPEELVRAIERLMNGNGRTGIAV
ncbi:MAG: hypothetical protein LAO76_07610 [Acidobacteriia bacterium]|nr:hypothetical protein [Terriglobia bacterium]